MTTAASVLAGEVLWSCECTDCLAWLRALPDDSVDLLFTSPPYRLARTYGLADRRGTEEWTAWMVELVKAAATKVRGLIAINCDGQTEDYQYHPTPYLLLADLHRAGFNARRPAFFHRIGIPGSGGPDWLRGDVEPIICITRPGKLPWSDSTACGHPPKWAPGGEMSNRKKDGSRANSVTVLTVYQLSSFLKGYCDATNSGAEEVLSGLRQALGAKTVSEWLAGIYARLHGARLLRPDVLGGSQGGSAEGTSGRCAGQSASAEDHAEGELPAVRIDTAPARSPRRRKPAEQQPGKPDGPVQLLPSEGTPSLATMHGLWSSEPVLGLLRQALPQVQEAWRSLDPASQSILAAHRGRLTDETPSLFDAGEQLVLTPARSPHGVNRDGKRVGARRGTNDHKASAETPKHTKRKVITRPREGMHAGQENTTYSEPVLANPGNVVQRLYTADEVAALLAQASEAVHCNVGGGQMGSKLAHENEAPFPLGLPTFFILSFCPPGGVVCDPFGGSGTTIDAAVQHGRRGISCDVRESQVDLARRRMRNCTPTLFSE